MAKIEDFIKTQIIKIIITIYKKMMIINKNKVISLINNLKIKII